MKAVLTDQYKDGPPFQAGHCDVEDVARAHAKCLGNQAAVGERLAIFSDDGRTPWGWEMNNLFRQGARDEGLLDGSEASRALLRSLNIGGKAKENLSPGKPMPWLIGKLLTIFGILPGFIMGSWKMDFRLDAAWVAKTEAILGFKLRPITETYGRALRGYANVMRSA